MKTLLEAREKEMQTLFLQAAKVEEELKKVDQAMPDRSVFWHIAFGMEDIVALLREIFAEAKNEMKLYLSMAMLREAKGLGKDLQLLFDAMSDKVKIYILFGDKEGMNKTIKFLETLGVSIPVHRRELRVTPILANSFVLVDEEKVIFDVRSPIDPDEYLAAIYIWEKNFGRKFSGNFKEMWKDARELHMT